ncbi:MAG: hypothetical protein M1816_008226 [Peltula sp. TS41687]|nr:MAG: hypothetical protein M1816_008226 [Peltula sp. TS41687]
MFSIAIVLALALIPTSVTPQTIDPKTVPIALRNARQFRPRSGQLMQSGKRTSSSATNASTFQTHSTLEYQCVCYSGQVPNASEYSQTIPYYTCTESNNQCVNRCAGSSSCQSACRENNPCGAKNPTRVNTSTITTMSSTSTAAGASSQTTGGTSGTASSGDAVYTTFGGTLPSSSAVNGQNAGSMAVELGRSYGLAAVAGGIFAGFALLL